IIDIHRRAGKVAHTFQIPPERVRENLVDGGGFHGRLLRVPRACDQASCWTGVRLRSNFLRNWIKSRHTNMLTHSRIWTAIDSLAQSNGLSASGLAKRAGLDPTTFNKSKRVAPDGRPRWPSTESLA